MAVEACCAFVLSQWLFSFSGTCNHAAPSLLQVLEEASRNKLIKNEVDGICPENRDGGACRNRAIQFPQPWAGEFVPAWTAKEQGDIVLGDK